MARNLTNKLLRKAVRNFERGIAKKAKSDPKAFYKYVNSRSKTRPVITNLRDENGTLVQNETGIAETLNKFFSSVFASEDMETISVVAAKPGINKLCDIKFTPEDVKTVLRNLKSSSSPGPDKVHPRVLKECAEELSEPLCMLFMKSLQEMKLLEEWKNGNITPIFKKGDRTKVENYRPISLTSVACKCMEKLIRNSLMKHMIENKLLSDKQHGFVPGRSGVTQLPEVLDAWTEVLDCGGRIDAVYLDFAKAFDTVPHQRLLVKLRAYGVDGAVHGWIKDFLDRRNQRVCLLGTESAWARVKSGVPQGSVLGPVLFICYINDLVEQVSSSIYMYADDTKIFRAVSGDTDTAQLQADLDAAVAWSLRWQLQFNETKCKVMEIAGKKKDKVNRTYLMGDGDNIVELENSDEERDLGILVDRTLSFNGHIEKAIAKANQILGLIKRTLVYFDRDTLKLLYCSLVRPHLEYANVVWHPQYKKHIKLLEGVQRRATRLLPMLAERPYQERLRLLGLPSLVYRRFRGDAIEVYKHVHGLYRSGLVMPLEDTKWRTTRGHCMPKTQEKFLQSKCSKKLFR